VRDGAGLALVEHESEQPCGVEPVDGRPALGAVCDVAGHPGALGGGDQHRGVGGSDAQALEVGQPAPLHLGARGGERVGRGV
jgi:hypothetical protein